MSFRRRGPRTLLPFGLDYADVDQSASGERMLYPLPINGRPTIVEDDSAKQFTHFAELMKNGSFYTGTLESLNHTDKKKSASYLEGGVNDGLTRYSDKFRTKIKVGRSIRDHPFILEFFPDELHNVMVPKDKKTRSLQLTHYSKGDKKDIGKLIKLSEVEKKKQIQERLDTVDGNEVESDTNVEEDEDEEFEDDYDDDYNAERYFEDGDDLGGEEEEGGNDEAAF